MTEELKQKAKEQCRILILSDKAYNVLADYDFWLDGYKHGQKDTFNIYDSEVTDMSNDYSYRLKNLQKENEGLKEELKNYATVINELMGTQLTDTDEVGRLIEIAHYRNWGEL